MTDSYRRRLTQIYQYLVRPGQRVLEIGCGRGDLLAALQPAVGVGVDCSEESLRLARQRHPGLRFIHADAHDLDLKEPFDVVLLSDVANELRDPEAVFRKLAALTTPRTRVILNTSNPLWKPPLALARCLGSGRPKSPPSWRSAEELAFQLGKANFDVMRRWNEVLWPLPVPFLASFANRYLAKLRPFNRLALTTFIVAEPRREAPRAEPRVSVVVPARNEAGTIEDLFRRLPEMGSGTELVFVEGHSKDDTYAAIQKSMAAHPERPCTLLRQTGVGKGDAVRLGFARASGDILMILDADLTVPPEDLPRFYEVLRSGRGDFANGVRTLFPMEREAMRFLNRLGNAFFSRMLSWLLGQPIRDTLCGTKVLWKADYERIAAGRAYFGEFDPFGDFDLLFGAAKLNLKIVEVPIHYRRRIYGTTNIQRWKHGWMLLKMVLFAAGRIKFV